jgi:hypothetical protein
VDPECSVSADPTECDALGFYNPVTSSSSSNTGQPFEITYGKGSVDGTYYLDTVLLAGKTLKTLGFISKTDKCGI